MRKIKYLLLVMLMAFPFVLCQAQAKKTISKSTNHVVEVLYFHGPQRCKTCVALEKATKEVLNSKFASQMKTGKVKYREIDLSIKDGEKLGDKYEVAWSSLIIVCKQGKKEKVADLTDDGFKYAVKNKAKIQSIIQNKINEFLK